MKRTILTLLVFLCPAWAQKRPLTHDDYDSWKHIQNQQLSPNGKYLAYAVFPQVGDGELVVRDLASGKDVRQSVGELPPPPRPNYALPQTEETPPPPPGIAVKFSPDSSTLVFSTFPTHEEVEKAKRAKKKPEDMPRGDVVVMKLASAEVFRAPAVKNFQLPTKATGFVAYLQQLPAQTTPEKSAVTPEKPASQPATKKIETGELVLRNINTGTERKFADVSEYTLTNDGALLVASVFSHTSDNNGVYWLKPGDPGEPKPLLTGKGKYEKLAWDQEQTTLAFVSDRDDASSKRPEFKLYDWDRKEKSAVELVSAKTAAFPAGWSISDQPPITISKGGTHIFFGTAPRGPTPEAADQTPADERVSVDLWSWKDDYIQPMQKVRAALERERSYRAVYNVADKKFVQLADPAMNEISVGESGNYAAGSDDREYRRMQEYDERYQDTYLVNTETGTRKLVEKRHTGRLTWAPDSGHAVFYDGKNWKAISVPDGQVVDLTAKLPVSFGREENDMPSAAASYGLAGWTKDGRSLLIYDRFDVWRIRPDGSSAVKITDGRASHLAFRVVRPVPSDPEDRWIDPAKPLLLRAENDETHDTGFYRTAVEGQKAPVELIMQPKNFAIPVKAKNADVYVTAESTFSEFPDLLVTDANFKHFEKVSNANPQLVELAWGTAEMIHFESADGVPLKATLYKPANFDPQKKYPMLVYIYERLTQNVNNFIEPRPTNVISPSYYASNGYLVLEPDIAYRIGYPGESAMHCVLPAVQKVVDQGFVNEKAIGIQGHSWGGYQIAYMVTRTNRFRAAAPGAPVADMISAYDGIRWGPGLPRQFQYERTQSRIGGSIWEYPLRYIENSPIFMADRVTTPLLMIHNDADDAVPWYQGIEYFLALRRLNKEVYMFSYNGEPHNLRRRANQKDYTIRLQQYFDYFLKGALKPEWMEKGIPFIDKPAVALSADSQ